MLFSCPKTCRLISPSKYLHRLSHSIPLPTSSSSSSALILCTSRAEHPSRYPSLSHVDRYLCTGPSSHRSMTQQHGQFCHAEALAKYEQENKHLRNKYIPYRDKCKSPAAWRHCECFSRPLFERLRNWMGLTRLRFCRRCGKFTARRKGREGVCKFSLVLVLGLRLFRGVICIGVAAV
jgi:hypothetical protein